MTGCVWTAVVEVSKVTEHTHTERNVEIEEIRRGGEERCQGSEDRRSGVTEEKKSREAMIFSKFDINSTTT